MANSFGSLAHQWSHGFVGGKVALADPAHAVVVCGSALKLIDTTTGAEQIFPSAGASIDIFAVSQEGGVCVYSERVTNPRLFVLDLSRGQVTATIKSRVPAVVKYADLALSSTGSHVAAIEDSPTFTLSVWELESGAPVLLAEASVTPLMNYRLSFSPSAWSTIFACAGAHVAVWSVEECRSNHFLTSKTYTLPFVNGARRRSSLVTDDVDDDLSLPALHTVAPPPSATCHAWVHAETVMVGCRLGEIFNLDVDSGLITIIHDGRDGQGSSDSMTAVLTENACTVVLGGSSNRLKFLSRANGFHVTRVVESVACVAVAAAAGAAEGEVDVVVGGPGVLGKVTKDGVVPFVKTHPSPPSAVGCYPGFVVTLASDGLRVFQETSGALLSFLAVTNTASITFHPAQPLLALGTVAGGVDLLTVSSDGSLVTLARSSVHPAAVTALAFDAQGTRLVSLGGGFLAVTDAAPGLPLLGHAAAPARVDAFAVGASSDGAGFVVVLAAGDKGKPSHITTLSVPDVLTSAHLDQSLSIHADVLQKKTFRVAAEIGSMAVLPSGSVVAMGRSHSSLVQFSLSATNNELVKPTTIPAHAVRGVGQVVAWGNGALLASVGADGAVCVVEGAKTGERVVLPVHTAAATALCGSQDGSRLFTVGPDGVLACIALAANSPAAKSAQSLVSSNMAKILARSSSVLPTLISGSSDKASPAPPQQQSSLVSAMAVAEKAAGSPAQQALVAKVQALRHQVLSLVESNSTKPTMEQLSREELAVDVSRRDALVAAKDQAIRGLKEEIFYKILAQQYLRHVVKLECWDAMETVGRTVYAFGEGLEVSNYPLARPDPAHELELRRVLLLRKIEAAEHRSRHPPRSPVPLGRTSSAFVFSTQPGPPEHRSTASEALSLVSHPAEPATPGSTSLNQTGFAQGEEDEEEESGAYNPLSLITSQRKRDQVVLLRQQVRAMKTAFNKQFDDVSRVKEDERAKIAERNTRIQEIMAELNIAEALFVPPPFLLENPQQLLEVKDGEVKVRRVLTAEEQAREETAKAKELERLANESKDNPRLRGLQDMMDGRLETKEGEELWIDPIPPPFMTGLAASDWSEEEKRVAGEFEKKKKEIAEERDKRRKALDAELRKLQEAIKTGCDSFDTRLQELFQAKIATEQAVTCEELRMLKLAKGLEDERDAVAMETELSSSIEALAQTQARLAPALAHARKAVAECQGEYETLVQADKMLEKTFKMRREFGDHSPHAEALFKLFKRRPKRHPAAQGEVVVPPLDRAVDCPDGVDDAAWAKLVELRQQKIESEAAVRVKMGELAEMTSFLNRRVAEDEELASAISDLQATIRAKAGDRMRAMLDMELLVVLKQGQVEVQHSNDFDPNYANAILIHRAAIEELNANLRKLALAKVEHLKQRMELRKGIHHLEWEHKRLDLEINDVTERSREIQLMRVTKDLVAAGGGSEEERHRKEVETLTKTIAVSETAFAQAAEEKKKAAAKLKKKTRKILEENGGLGERLEGLERLVSDRSAIHRVQAAIVGDGGRQQRMKELATQRRLQNAAEAQSEDLGSLRDEVERLRMRTFPAFGRADPRIV